MNEPQRPSRKGSKTLVLICLAIGLLPLVGWIVVPSNRSLIERAAGPDLASAQAARESLVWRGSWATPDLLLALEHPDGRARAAARVLDELGDPVHEPARQLIKGGTDRQLLFAAIFLLRRHDRTVFSALLARAALTTDPFLRESLHLVLYGLSSDRQGDYSPQGDARLVIGIGPSDDLHGARREVLAKAASLFTLESAEAWFQAHRAEFPPQY